MTNEIQAEKHENFYYSLRGKINRWLEQKTGKNHKYAKYLLFAPDLFYLLLQVVKDPRVAKKDKALTLGAIGYFILPIDVIPEGIIGPGGYIDDIIVASFVLQTIVNHLSPEIIREHWAGDEDGLEIVNKIAGLSQKVMGKGVVPKIISKFTK
ncbi:YkvA family protein [Jeotgalibacillus proteolyticus]|uniref:YkvA family protein n=1 Tax=Jeotgalibacillus proteolyticus TaxID=2082395 RepID=UPI003CF0120A